MAKSQPNSLRTIVKCIIKNKLAYINQDGKIVWNALRYKSDGLISHNIDYMNRGYFYANSKPNEKDMGGLRCSDNYPRKISKKKIFPAKAVSIVVNSGIRDNVHNTYLGLTVFVANSTKEKIGFNAQDCRLYMKVQAKNQIGEWVDIEYLPNSWCGVSYHMLVLEPNHFWSFSTPVYEGDFKTKLRIELKYIGPTDQSDNHRGKREITIYSNEYEGSVNPGQFWRKGDYFPNGLLDPYNE